MAPPSKNLRRLSRPAEWLARGILVIFSLLVTLAGLELACRAYRGPEWLARWPNFITHQRSVFQGELQRQFVFDATLGYVPRPDFRSARVNHDERGMRVSPSGPGEQLDTPPVLVTGDSFAYGDEIADAETWPTMLQALLHRQTLNAGVVGYGLDQIVLRTEQQAAVAAPALVPAAIVASFIADDLRRNEYSHAWGKEKPYFTLAPDGTLVLRNVPVPQDADRASGLSFLQRALGWSALAEIVMRRLGNAYEWQGAGARATPAGSGETLACPLMQRLARIGVPTLVVGLYAPSVWRLDPRPQWVIDEIRQTRQTLACAAAAGLATLDMYDTLDKAVRERGRDAIFFNFHVSAEGNRHIAAAVAAELARRHLP